LKTDVLGRVRTPREWREFRLLAKEIEIVNADRMLAAEFVAGKTPSAQPAPDKFSAHVSFLRSWRARSVSAMKQI
jgi:hypothetical protein